MGLFSLNCNNCNGQIDLDLDKMYGFCPYCGKKLYFDMDQMGKIMADTKKGKKREKMQQLVKLQFVVLF